MTHNRKNGQKQSQPICLWNGLLEEKHRRRIGPAIWLYLELLDKITREDPQGIGWVLGGKPVKAEDFRGKQWTNREHLKRLRRFGYISTRRTPYGFVIGVTNSLTGVGKTLLASQTRATSCRQGFHSLYCSAEMTAAHLKGRELAANAGVSPTKMRREDLLTPEDWRSLIEAASHECKNCKILDGELSLSRIRRAARRMKKTDGLDLIVLDYDELIDAPGETELDQQRTLVRAAKTLGVELKCVVILISQLRKALNKEDAKRPSLQRLYGTGAKAKHSSFVIFADRPWVREMQGDEKQAKLFILKSRDGQTGPVSTVFDIRKLRFSDAAEVRASARHFTDVEREEE